MSLSSFSKPIVSPCIVLLFTLWEKGSFLISELVEEPSFIWAVGKIVYRNIALLKRIFIIVDFSTSIFRTIILT